MTNKLLSKLNKKFKKRTKEFNKENNGISAELKYRHITHDSNDLEVTFYTETNDNLWVIFYDYDNDEDINNNETLLDMCLDDVDFCRCFIKNRYTYKDICKLKEVG